MPKNRTPLDRLDPEALLMEPRGVFDKCITGARSRVPNGTIVAVYSTEKIIQVIVDTDGMSEEDAIEYVDFNVLGGWLGEGTPIYE